MISALSVTPEKILSLQEASKYLNVSVDTLLEWNENNILKPTITLNGDVGYRQGQIDKFLKIQNTASSDFPKNSEIISPQTIQQISSETTDYVNPLTAGKTPAKTSFNTILTTAFSFSLMAALTLIVIGKSGGYLNVEYPSDDSSKETDSAQAKLSNPRAEKINFSVNPAVSFYTTGTNQTGLSYNGGANSPGNSLTAPYLFQNGFSSENTNNYHDKLEQVAFSDIKKPEDSFSNTNGTFDSVPANYSSRGFNTSQDSVFDEDGNIKGDNTDTEQLAAILGVSRLIQQSKPSSQSSQNGLLVALLAISVMTSAILAKSRFGYQPKVQNLVTVSVPVYSEPILSSKLLELNQKTDGTVVLNFKGIEYKISKPEFNSESDQFIERLMEITKDNIKEFNYDILMDEKLRLDAPLSKLVTRLGFVGIKRELFFPRTSKTRVLFRRYITVGDLASIGMSADQIGTALIS